MSLVPQSRKYSHELMHLLTRVAFAHPAPPVLAPWRALGEKKKIIKTLTTPNITESKMSNSLRK